MSSSEVMIDFESVIKTEGINREIGELIDFETVIKARELKQSELKKAKNDAKYCSKCLKKGIRHFKCSQCSITPDQLKRKNKKLKRQLKKPKAQKATENIIEELNFQCSECDKAFHTIVRLSNHQQRFHNAEHSNKATRGINESLESLSKNYSTQLAVQEELKLNIPSNLRTYTRKKPPVLKIKEEPEFIVPD